MKYTVKEDVWEDLITGQRYTRDYAFRPLVSFNEKGEIIHGYVYSPYGVAEDFEHKSTKEFGFQAYCFGQKLFLTDAQINERFKYLGKLERHEDIDKNIKEYTEENCNFENLEWLAQLTLRDLTSHNSGGQFQCIHAKLLEFLFKHAPSSEKMEKLKKIYFNNEEKGKS